MKTHNPDQKLHEFTFGCELTSGGTKEGVATPQTVEMQAALATLVNTLVAHRAAHPKRSQAGWTLYSGTGDRLVVQARDILDDPISFALKGGIRRLGQAAYDLHGMGALRDIVDRVAGDDARRGVPVDDALHGVGSGNDRWGS
jgi:hypothetical protein